ncbi:MAG: hypothetical protein ACR2QX_03525 [Woeseiaceae bacterium]
MTKAEQARIVAWMVMRSWQQRLIARLGATPGLHPPIKRRSEIYVVKLS